MSTQAGAVEDVDLLHPSSTHFCSLTGDLRRPSVLLKEQWHSGVRLLPSPLPSLPFAASGGSRWSFGSPW